VIPVNGHARNLDLLAPTLAGKGKKGACAAAELALLPLPRRNRLGHYSARAGKNRIFLAAWYGTDGADE